MIDRRRVAGVVFAGLIIGGASLAAAAPVVGGGHLKVLLEGLSSPKALAAGTAKDLFIGQGAFGPPGPVLAYHLKGPGKGTADPVSDPVNVIDLAIGSNGAGWAIGGDRWLYRVAKDGTYTPLVDIAAYQAVDIDPYNNPLEDPAESNPYGLAVLPGGDALIADAAGNDVLRVDRHGHVTTVARFTREKISTSHLGDPSLPPTIKAEAVPTSIAVGRDGKVYVGQLMGYPFRPGTSHIWRLDPNAKGAICSVKIKDRHCSVYKSGFTAVVDLAYDKQSGKLYVYELARGGVIPFEEGFATLDFPPAVLLEVSHGRRTELARGELSEPGGVVVRDGTVYVTDGVFTGGRLVKLLGHH